MRFSKHIYLDDDRATDSEIKTLSQKEIRERLRLGHLFLSVVGSAAASSLKEIINVDKNQQVVALVETLLHYQKINGKTGSKNSDDPKTAIIMNSVAQPEPEPEPEPEQKQNRKTMFGKLPNA